MLLYRTTTGWVLKTADRFVQIPQHAGAGITTREDLFEFLEGIAKLGASAVEPAEILAPMESQEIWASGLTYYRSRDARMAGSHDELFLKGTPHRVAAPSTAVRIRRDSNWKITIDGIGTLSNTVEQLS
jgi:2-dehydro-3-deoxy-D-arabinonate dehydratase